ncbi:EamA family transporter [Brevibacillus sp. SYP-B805]|uniref:DMT family transporter n=1 Tax=Brevibacillus sp. SYP-B805 TaxID=1578199 RepID=UPI0013EDBA1E|nr:EamA family transporter [Brevibacillus sp. SYP-B805]NGQ93798.1 EamA family transporter [Brevibacillus sp. SYP-B805]
MLLVAVALWGITIAPTKWALESMPPFTLMFLRLFCASLFFLPYAWMKAKRETETSPSVPWLRMCSLSFTGVAGYFLFNYLGIGLTSGVNYSIISASLPLCTILLAALYLKEKITIPQWGGLLLGLAGVLLITVHPAGAGGGTLLGDLLVLASDMIWAFYVVQMKKPQGEAALPSELFTALTLGIGAMMILPFTLVEIGVSGLPAVTPKGWVSLAVLVVGPTILAYWLWNRAMESVSAGKAGLYLNALPVISVITSIVLLGEALTWKTFVGGLLVLSGVLWAEKKERISSVANQA